MIVELSKNVILKLQVIIFVKLVVLQIQTKPQLKTKKKLIIGICLFDKKIINYFANRYTLRYTIIIC